VLSLSSLSPLAVLVDMDGLLIDSEPLWSDVLDAFCARRGQRYTAVDAAACLGRGIDRCAEYLIATYGFEGEASAHVDEIERGFEACAGSAPACKGAEALLLALAGETKLALGSSSARPLVQAALGPRGWLSRFDVVVTGSDVARKKPAPDIYLEAARQLGVAPARCVVLEDSPAGCASGRAAGATVIAVTHDVDAVRGHADHVFPDLYAVARALGLRVEEIATSSTGTHSAL